MQRSGTQVPLTMPAGRANYSGPVVEQEASVAAVAIAAASVSSARCSLHLSGSEFKVQRLATS